MRGTKMLAMLVLLCAPNCFGQVVPAATTGKPSSPNPAFVITVAPPAGQLRLGPPINVTITVKNISDKEIPWRTEKSDTAYQAFQILLAKNGRKVETTAFHRKIRSEQRPDDPPEVQSGGSILFSLSPGKSITWTVDPKRLYQITEPGTYTLDVSRIEDDNGTVVRAKTLTLEIEP